MRTKMTLQMLLIVVAISVASAAQAGMLNNGMNVNLVNSSNMMVNIPKSMISSNSLIPKIPIIPPDFGTSGPRFPIDSIRHPITINSVPQTVIPIPPPPRPEFKMIVPICLERDEYVKWTDLNGNVHYEKKNRCF